MTGVFLPLLAADQVNIQWKYDAKWGGGFWTPADWSDGGNWEGTAASALARLTVTGELAAVVGTLSVAAGAKVTLDGGTPLTVAALGEMGGTVDDSIALSARRRGRSTSRRRTGRAS